jgi:hypothetical protein
MFKSQKSIQIAGVLKGSSDLHPIWSPISNYDHASLLSLLTGFETINAMSECATSAAASVVVSPGLSYIGATSTATLNQ